MYYNIKNLYIFFIILFSIYCALTLGIEWDARTHLTMGKNRLNYFFSLGNINNQLWFSEFFPGLSYTISAFIVQIFPKKIEYEILHLVNLTFSFGAAFAFFKIVKILFNKEVGLISFILLTLYPAFFGHMSTNPKDTIIAFSFLWIIYYILKYLQNQNDKEKSNSYIVKISILLVIGSGVRIIFASTLIPVFLFLIAEIFYFKKFLNKKFSNKKFIVDFAKIFTLTYLILIIFWPQVHDNILTDPFKIFLKMFNSPPVGASAGLLNGNFYFVTDTPKNYILINILLRTPEYILALYFFSLIFLIQYNSFFIKKFKNFNYKFIFILNILIISNLVFYFSPIGFYDGLRIFLYLLPFFLVIPSLCLFLIIKKISAINFKIIFLIISISFVFFIIRFFSITPYHYTYLNYINGKSINHSSLFENDYKGLSLKELLKKSEHINHKGSKIYVCGAESGNVKHYLKKLGYSKIRLVRLNENYNYLLMTNRVDWGFAELSEAKTCYQKFKDHKKIHSTVIRNGLILSKIVSK